MKILTLSEFKQLYWHDILRRQLAYFEMVNIEAQKYGEHQRNPHWDIEDVAAEVYGDYLKLQNNAQPSPTT